MKNKIHIVSTAALSDTLMSRLAENHIETEAYPFIRTTTSLTNESKQRIRELETHSPVTVFTSANAVHAVGESLQSQPDWKIYCIQGATRQAVAQYFKENSVIGTAANASALVTRIISAEEANLVFFCGQQRLDTLPFELTKNNIAVEEIAVYQTELTPVKIETKAEGILFFSASAVKSFLSMNRPLASAICFAIGETTAKALKDALPNPVIIAKNPGKNEIVDLVIKYYNEHN